MPRPSTPAKRAGVSTVPSRPTSPPQTPKSASASANQKNRKGNWGGRSRQSRQQQAIRDQMSHAHFGAQFLDDLDDGPIFGYRPGTSRLSPRSIISSSEDDIENDDAEEEEEEDQESEPESSTSDSPPRSCSSRQSRESPSWVRPQPSVPHGGRQRTFSHVISGTFILESLEIIEAGDSDVEDGCIVLQPDYIEDADSESSRSRSRSRSRLRDSQMASNMHDLNVFDSEDEDEETERERRMREHQAKKRLARMSSGSITKRTVSERGSDSDSEDLANGHGIPGPHDPKDAAHRRQRRKTARNSIIFQAPRIDEADEPDSNDEVTDALARELPFFLYHSMEVDSP